MKSELRVRIVCHNPPPAEWEGAPALFGLQDTGGALHPGVDQSDGSIRFEAEVGLRIEPSGAVRFSGPFVHGPTGQKHLYLSYRHTTEGSPWIGRIKVPLSFTATEAEQGGVLEVAISAIQPDGKRARSKVPFIDGGWRLADAPR